MKIRLFNKINESIETASQFKFVKISNREALFILRNDNKFTILNDVKDNELSDDFYTTNHYLIYYKDVMIGIIGYNDYFNTWNSSHPEMTHMKNPVTGEIEETGHYTLWIEILELCKEAKLKFPNMSPVEFVKSILDYLILYCKKHGYKAIHCGAKNDRVAKLYKYAGFLEYSHNLLVYLIED